MKSTNRFARGNRASEAKNRAQNYKSQNNFTGRRDKLQNIFVNDQMNYEDVLKLKTREAIRENF